MLYAAIDIAATGTLITAIAGRRIRVLGYSTTTAGAVTVTWLSATTKLTGAISHITGVPHVAGPGDGLDPQPLFICAVGEDLKITLGSGVQTSGWIVYDIVGT